MITRMTWLSLLHLRGALIVSVLLHGSEAWPTTLADRRHFDIFDMRCQRRSCVCSGSSTSATKASVNAPSNQQQHPSYDNAPYAGSDTSSACHPSSPYEWYKTSTQICMARKDQEVAPKLDGLIPSSTTSMLMASTST